MPSPSIIASNYDVPSAGRATLRMRDPDTPGRHLASPVKSVRLAIGELSR